MDEKRLADRLSKYWERLKGASQIPNYLHVNPSSIDDLWGKCINISVEPSPQQNNQYKYQYVGKNIESSWGSNIQGKNVGTVPVGVMKGRRTIDILSKVYEEKLIMHDEGKFVNDKNKVVKYRMCLLPFGSGQDYVTNIVVGVSWKEFG